jgi:hypothetical protein
MKRIVDLIPAGNYVELAELIEQKIAKTIISKIDEEKKKFVDQCKKNKAAGKPLFGKEKKSTSSSEG